MTSTPVLPAKPRRLRGFGRNSLERRLLDFFAANPYEELTRADVQVKFCVGHSVVERVLAKLGRDGVLERVSVYRVAAPEATLDDAPSDLDIEEAP